MHYEIQNFISVDDMLKKIGKSQRIFGKGGMVDTNKVRVKVLSDWYSGKLNSLMVESNKWTTQFRRSFIITVI